MVSHGVSLVINFACFRKLCCFYWDFMSTCYSKKNSSFGIFFQKNGIRCRNVIPIFFEILQLDLPRKVVVIKRTQEIRRNYKKDQVTCRHVIPMFSKGNAPCPGNRRHDITNIEA